ncbi:hypothetical protein SAY86_020157 [Trapa natans]|uniref:Acyl carrier protein n=1 Tax=Trapa natans TaxID=22666 RepID=A0AAN7R7F7_TRANT|nr:hypothetical protein SAY86_020157 [Trapa natans]
MYLSPVRRYTPDAHLGNDLKLDSLDTVGIIMVLKQEFEFEIPGNETTKVILMSVPWHIFAGLLPSFA